MQHLELPKDSTPSLMEVTGGPNDVIYSRASVLLATHAGDQRERQTVVGLSDTALRVIERAMRGRCVSSSDTSRHDMLVWRSTLDKLIELNLAPQK